MHEGEFRKTLVNSLMVVRAFRKRKIEIDASLAVRFREMIYARIFPLPGTENRRRTESCTVASLAFLFPFLSSSRPFSLPHTQISTYEIFDAEASPSRTV